MRYLLSQNVDVVAHLTGRDLIFLRLFALLVIGLFDDLHLHTDITQNVTQNIKDFKQS